MADPTPNPAPPVPSEAAERRRWERCAENALAKTAKGGLAGGLASFVLFSHPVARAVSVGFGAGMGAGVAWSDCRSVFNDRAVDFSSLRDLPQTLRGAAKKLEAMVDKARAGVAGGGGADASK